MRWLRRAAESLVGFLCTIIMVGGMMAGISGVMDDSARMLGIGVAAFFVGRRGLQKIVERSVERTMRGSDAR